MSSRQVKRRTRVWRRDGWRLAHVFWSGTGGLVNASGSANITGTQMTASEGHPWPYRGSGVRDVGGDFYTINRRFNDDRKEDPSNRPTWQVKGTNFSGTYTYSGPLYAVDPVAKLQGLVYDPYPKDTYSADNAGLDALGTTAIARCAPTNSAADLSVALAELAREGVPKMLGATLAKEGVTNRRSYGGEYLNWQFGWAPLISSVKDAAGAAIKAEELWSQYVRDAGRLVRRRYEFPHELTEEPPVVVSTSAMPIMMGPTTSDSNMVTKRGTLTRTRRIEKRTWFSGAFTYQLPHTSTEAGKLVEAATYARKVYGVKLDPEVLWNLAPWSWAIDWVTNTGDLARNVSNFAQYGLVMPYGYVMQNVRITDTYELTGFEWGPLNSGLPTRLSCSFTTEVKNRRRATPFGFGASFDGFTSGQWAILAALGITRR